ncbi:MAG: C-GCAxxG-C-C family protein, partial [Proteobacteria bacterium]|nr:C-GCAxxG-C-C family protein [Pseudomonadota bacterium]
QSDIIPRIASGFCSGISRTDGPCGALTGAVMGLGLAFGRDEPADSDESKMKIGHCYAKTAQFFKRFEARFGTTTCTGLTGCNFSIPEDLARFREEKRIERCYDFVEEAARIAAELMEG